MLKKYIFSQIKNLFVPSVIALIVLLTSGIIIGSNAEPVVTYSVYQNGMIFTRTIERVVNSNTINILPLIIIATLLAWLYPLWVFNYRYSLKKVDLFYQAPLKENTIKKTRLLVLFIYLTIGYLLGLILILVFNEIKFNHYASFLPTSIPLNPTSLYIKIAVRPELIFVLIESIVGYLAIGAMYFISSYVVSKANSLINAIINALFIIFVLDLIVILPANAVTIKDSYLSILSEFGFGPIHAEIGVGSILEPLAGGTYYKYVNYQSYNNYVIDYIVYILLGVASFLGLLFEKEPSGEYAGHSSKKEYFTRILCHFFFGLVLITPSLFYVNLNITGPVASFIVFSISYYLIVSLINRSFKITKTDIIIMSTVAATSLAFIIYRGFINALLMDRHYINI